MSKNEGEEQEPKEESKDRLEETSQTNVKDNKNNITKTTKKIKKEKEDVAIKDNRKSLWAIILFSIIVIFILIVSVIFALVNINNEKILNKISIMGIDVSNMTREEAKKAVSEVVDAKITEEFILKKDEYETTLNANQISARV